MNEIEDYPGTMGIRELFYKAHAISQSIRLEIRPASKSVSTRQMPKRSGDQGR